MKIYGRVESTLMWHQGWLCERGEFDAAGLAKVRRVRRQTLAAFREEGGRTYEADPDHFVMA